MWRKEQLERTKNCGLCGSGQFRTIGTRLDGLPLSECRRCGYAYLGKRPRADALMGYYNRDYFQGSQTYQDYFNYAQAVADLNFSHQLERVYPFIGKWNHLRVLEIGCAAGGNLAVLRRKGAIVKGIEISTEASALARERFGIDVFTGPIEAAVLAPAAFDVILLFDILEHLQEPGPALSLLASAIDSGGWIAVTVPNFDRFDVEGMAWDGLTGFEEHLGYFRRTVLTEKLTSLGFDIFDQHTFTSSTLNHGFSFQKILRRRKQALVERHPALDVPWRLLRKFKFLLNGPPKLDLRTDGSGLDQFVIARKKNNNEETP